MQTSTLGTMTFEITSKEAARRFVRDLGESLKKPSVPVENDVPTLTRKEILELVEQCRHGSKNETFRRPAF